MGVQFTIEQQTAVDTLDKSILVSAAAGSGKTAVLVQRIINIILSGRANVDGMLVVTFTKAAASEMKLKLIKAVKEAVRSSDDGDKRRLLNAQLDMMYRAYISTIDAFALRIIKEFFYEVDIEPNFSLCDEVQASLMQMDAVNELFEECFENDGLVEGASFRDFLDHYSAERGEEELIGSILSTYNALRSMPNYMEWAFAEVEKLKLPEGGWRKSPVCEMMRESALFKLRSALDKAKNIKDALLESGFEIYAEAMCEDIESIEAYIREVEEAGLSDELLSDMAGHSWASFRKKIKDETLKAEWDECYKGDISDARDVYKKIVKKKIPEAFATPSIEARFKELDETFKYAEYYLKLLVEFEKRFADRKRERNVMDFSDLSHTAVKILEKPEIADALRERFKYIFIDEYQDTNRLQEYMLGRIARSDNMFKVGDLKQSIYGFRQSEPEIFRETAKAYSSPENTDAVTIDLNRNFRSNSATLRYVNDVFKDLMPGYDAAARLYPGLDMPAEYDYIPEVHALIDDGASRESGEDGEEVLQDAEIVDRSKVEAEAEYVADLVADLAGTEFYDCKSGTLRRASMRDIVILLRDKRGKADIYYKALSGRNIAAHISEPDGFFDTVEIRVATALLETIDNMKRDVSLIAALHSEVFGFTPEDLAEIRAEYIEAKGKEGRYDEYGKALSYYAEHGPVEELRIKVGDACASINEWKKRSRSMPLDDFIWRVLIESDYYLYAGAMYGGGQRQANLRALVDKARVYKESGVSSLGDFLRYIDILKRNGVKTGQAMTISEDDDVVRIMTIHKSKGLEFPFVIVAGLGTRPRVPVIQKGFVFDPEYGVAISYVDREERYWRPSVMQQLIIDKKTEDEYQELLRVLYVAMTRARNKLILTGSVSSEADLTSRAEKRGSIYNIIRPSLDISSSRLLTAMLSRRTELRRRTGIEDFMRRRDRGEIAESGDVSAEVERRLGYRYPHEEDLRTRAKYTVSEMRREILSLTEAEYAEEASSVSERGEVVRIPDFLRGRKLSAAELGTAYHRVMEYADFTRAYEPGYIEGVAATLCSSGAVREECFDAMEPERIRGFFDADIGKRAVRAAADGTLRKEKPFTMRTELGGRELLVQGIIDACWVEDGEYIIVDYKTSYVSGGKAGDSELARISDEYREQIRLYAEAVEKGSGLRVREAYLYLFSAGRAVPVRL